MKIHHKNQINKNASSNVTIIIANTKYTVNAVPITQVEAGNNILQYKAIGKFSHEERLLLNDSLKQAYIYINDTYRLLQKPSTQTIERLETILGDMEDTDLKTLISKIKQIQDKILSPKLVVLKEDYLDTEKDHILASVKEDDTFTFTVYENFFDKKEFKDNRAGVIVHELCHLCDIEEGADMYDMDSAECLKNITLCLCEKLTLKQIRQEYARKQEPQERNDDTLTYDENQPRHEKGTSEGGRWKKVGDKSEASSNDDADKSTAKNNDKNDKPKDSDKSTSDRKPTEDRYKELASKTKLTVSETKEIISTSMEFMAEFSDMIKEKTGKTLIFDSEDVRDMLLSTAIKETSLRPRPQDERMKNDKLVRGNAIGLFQMEKETFDDLMNNYLPKRQPELLKLIKFAFTPAGGELNHAQMGKDPFFAAVMARVRYYTAKPAIPKAGKIEAQAAYWFDYFNRGKAEDRDSEMAKFIKERKYFNKYGK